MFLGDFLTMNKFQEDPQLALTTLQNIAEEIPSGVSASEVGTIVTQIKYPDEITQKLRDEVSQKLKTSLEKFWSSYNVSEKLSNIKNLSRSECPIVPLSPKSQVISLHAKCLRSVKEEIEKKIKELQMENAELEQQIKAQTELCQKQMEDIESCDLSL